MAIPYRPDLYTAFPLTGFKIMVNPGHGEKKGKANIATGAAGKIGKKTVFEKDLNDKVAKNVERKLKLLGAEVVYVDNTPVKEIPDIENRVWPDAFISVHHDAKSADGRRNSGETVFVAQESGSNLGKMINRHLRADKSIPNNGVNSSWGKKLKVLQAEKSIPAVLVEIGFMTNPNELKLTNTQEYQDKAAQCIVDGTKEFLVTKRKNSKMHKKVDKSPDIQYKKLMYSLNSLWPKPVGEDI